MRVRSLVVFILAVGLSLAGAGYRFYDSSHAMGTVSMKGGKARHPFHLDPGKNLYALIATAVVLPPYRGDARIVLEGAPSMSYAIYDSAPIVELGLHRRPRFENNTLYDLQPRDRLALWVVMQPAQEDSAAGSADGEKKRPLCCPPPTTLDNNSTAGEQHQHPDTLALNFYDTKTGRPILKIPVMFNDAGGSHVH